MSGGNNGKVLTVSRKLAKILTDSRKSHHPIETLLLLVIIAELAECSRICTAGTPKPRLCIVVQWSVHWAPSRTTRVLVLAGARRCALETCGEKKCGWAKSIC